MVQTNLKFSCIHCGTCCTDKNTLVNLTYFDILRIKNGLKLNLEELLEIIGFYIFKEQPTNVELEKMVIPPIETENGLAFIGLRKSIEGECIFYDKSKKSCPIYSLRPNFCRTFPFTFSLSLKDIENQINIDYTEKGLEYCKGITTDSPNIVKEKWIKLGKKVIKDIANNNVLTENWNKSVENNKIIPSARNFLLTILNIGND